MLKQILVNTIADALGRNPTNEEFTFFVDQLQEQYADAIKDGKKILPTDIELWVRETRDGYFKQCDECGEWYMMGDEIWNNEELGDYCIDCIPYQDPDMMPGGHDYY